MGERAPTDPTRGTRDDRWSKLEGEAYCYLTTVGRSTGRPHTIEIWFVLRGVTLYMLSGGGAGSDSFATTGEGPDGIAVDDAGNLFVATGSGIEVFAPDGARWGVIPVLRIPANCAFGGADGRTLFITAREGLYRVTLANPGLY